MVNDEDNGSLLQQIGNIYVVSLIMCKISESIILLEDHVYLIGIRLRSMLNRMAHDYTNRVMVMLFC